MNSATNLFLLLLPPELLGLLTVAVIIAGGFLVMIGARRKGTALVVTGMSLPLVLILVEALMNDLFTALPEWLVIPVSVAITTIIYLLVVWAFVKLVFGQRAIDEAKGHLLADAARWILRRTFSGKGALVFGALLLVLSIGFAG